MNIIFKSIINENREKKIILVLNFHDINDHPKNYNYF